MKRRRLRVYHLWHGVHVCSSTEPRQLFNQPVWVGITARLYKGRCHIPASASAWVSLTPWGSCISQLWSTGPFPLISGQYCRREARLPLSEALTPSLRAFYTSSLASQFWSLVSFRFPHNHTDIHSAPWIAVIHSTANPKQPIRIRNRAETGFKANSLHVPEILPMWACAHRNRRGKGRTKIITIRNA